MSLVVEVPEEINLMAGECQAVCSNYYDLGIQTSTFNEKEVEQHKVIIVWELEKRNESTGKRFLVNKEYTLSLSKKANLTKDLASWRGKPFEAGEKIDLEKLIGANCILTVGENEKGYNVIEAIKPNTKGLTAIKPEYKRDFCPDFIANKIKKGRFPNSSATKNPWEDDNPAASDDDKMPF